MAGMISAANLGGVADPRLNSEADDIGKSRHASVAAESVPRSRRLSHIYTDSSISFEDYHYCMLAAAHIVRRT